MMNSLHNYTSLFAHDVSVKVSKLDCVCARACVCARVCVCVCVSHRSA